VRIACDERAIGKRNDIEHLGGIVNAWYDFAEVVAGVEHELKVPPLCREPLFPFATRHRDCASELT
jgi:hypothetical protein